MSGFGPTTAKVERTRRLKLAACFGLASVFAVAAEDPCPPAVGVTVQQADDLVSAGKAVYRIGVPGSWGTGFFIAPNRLATNFHVVDGIQDIGDVSLYFDNERSSICATRLLAVSFPYDLALLETEGSPAVHLPAGGSPQGTVFTIGYPDRPDLQYHRSVSGVRNVRDMYYTGFFNLGLGPGSSGSPVLDSQGRFFAVLFQGDEMVGGFGFSVDVDNAVASKKTFVDARWLAQLANGREGTLCQGSVQACLDHEISRTKKLVNKVLSGHSVERQSLGIFHTTRYGLGETLGESQENQKEFLERMATNFDDPKAQYDLGVLYDKQDEWEKAARWYKSAAKGGMPMAQYSLGALYDEQDEWEKAARWYKSAAEGGVPMAQHNLGGLYHQREEWEKAARWYKSAAKLGVPNAQYRLGLLYHQQDELEQAARWYKSAAKLGVPDAQHVLSEMYRYGEGVEQNDELADHWMAKCSEAKGSECSCEETEGFECSE